MYVSSQTLKDNLRSNANKKAATNMPERMHRKGVAAGRYQDAVFATSR